MKYISVWVGRSICYFYCSFRIIIYICEFVMCMCVSLSLSVCETSFTILDYSSAILFVTWLLQLYKIQINEVCLDLCEFRFL